MRCRPKFVDSWSNKTRRLLLSAVVTAIVALTIALIVAGAVYLSMYKTPVPYITGAGAALIGQITTNMMGTYMKKVKDDRKLPLMPYFSYQGGADSTRRGWDELVQNKTVFCGTETDHLHEFGPPPGQAFESVPLVRSAIAIGYNVPECPDGLNISLKNLALIYTWNITNWNDGRLHGDAPCLEKIEDQFLTSWYRTNTSGSSHAFAEALHRYHGDIFTKEPGIVWPYPLIREKEYITIASADDMLFLVNTTRYSIGFLPASSSAVFITVKYVAVNGIPMSNGAFQKSLDWANQNRSLEFPPLDECPGCWPIMTNSYVTMRNGWKQNVKTQAFDASDPISCSNQHEMVRFLRWSLDTKPQTFGHTPLSDAMKQHAISTLERLHCNSRPLLGDYYLNRPRALVATVANLAGFTAFCLVVSVALLLIGYNESLYTKDRKLLAAVGGDDEFGLSATLLQNCKNYDDELGIVVDDAALSVPNEADDLSVLQHSMGSKPHSTTLDDSLVPLDESASPLASAPGASPSSSNVGHPASSSNSSSTSQSPIHIRMSDITMGRLIGSGSFGDVFEGKYNRMTVAIKRIPVAHDPELMQSFMREVRAMLSLNHHHVLKLVGLAIQAPYTYIISEYCKNGSLDHYIRTNPSNAPYMARIRWAHQAAQGIAYLHSKDIIHRDLKLNNLLLDLDLQVKVADLGTAALSSNRTQRTRAGTLDHTAPEMLEGKPYDKSCDMYSFGICLWSLFSNAPLYPGFTMYEIISKVTIGYRPPLDLIPSARLCEIISCCWDQDPSKRYTFDQLVDILAKLDDSDFLSFI